MDASFNTLYKPVFFQEVPALQDIVICQMIQYTWHKELSMQKLEGKLAAFLDYCDFLAVTLDLKCQTMKFRWNVEWKETQMSKYISKVAVSLSEQMKIQLNMELYAWNLRREFIIWIRFHSINVFYDIRKIRYSIVVELLYNFDEFVYDVYGRIDYEKTAKNLLISVQLTPYHKFIISCLYCFEEEIEQLWPSVQTQLRLDDPIIDGNVLIHYWITRLADLDPNPLLYDPSSMFAQHSKTYSAMKYFWKNVTTFDEKVNCIGSCFECRNTRAVIQCINFWFPKMDDKFLKCVISRYGVTIMVTLIQTLLCQKFILSFWQHTSNMFDGDQFINILQRINAEKFRDFKLICRVLWHNTPMKLKTHALNHYQIEDSFDALNRLMKIVYTQNPYYLNNGGALMIPSDVMYFPTGCECANDPEGEDCKCETLLQ